MKGALKTDVVYVCSWKTILRERCGVFSYERNTTGLTNRVVIYTNGRRGFEENKFYLTSFEHEWIGPFYTWEEVVGEIEYLKDKLGYYVPGKTWEIRKSFGKLVKTFKVGNVGE